VGIPQSPNPVSGLVGSVFAVASLTEIFGLIFYEAFINPVVALEAPAFVD